MEGFNQNLPEVDIFTGNLSVYSDSGPTYPTPMRVCSLTVHVRCISYFTSVGSDSLNVDVNQQKQLHVNNNNNMLIW